MERMEISWARDGHVSVQDGSSGGAKWQLPTQGRERMV